MSSFFSFFSSLPVAAVMWQVDTARGATDPRSGGGRPSYSVEARWSTVGYGQVTSISKGRLTGPAIGLDMSAPVAVPVIL